METQGAVSAAAAAPKTGLVAGWSSESRELCPEHQVSDILGAIVFFNYIVLIAGLELYIIVKKPGILTYLKIFFFKVLLKKNISRFLNLDLTLSIGPL